MFPIRNSRFLLLFLLILIVVSGWISDDASITLRVVDNFLNGYGMRWNVAERVQVFTHPLWFFFLCGTSALTGEYFLSSVAISFLVSVAAILILYRGLAANEVNRWWGLALLCASMSFIDYSTSGLENPLSHLLVALFALNIVHPAQSFSRRLNLCLTSGLLMCTRMDLALLCLPALLGSVVTTKPWKWIAPSILGFFPFVAWELFSVFYYGSFFPNTAYAKLAAKLSRATVLEQGYLYYFDSLVRDPLTLLVILIGAAFALTRPTAGLRGIGVGIAAYLLYVFWIGGDFMSGRFFSTPFFLSVCVLLHSVSFMEKLRSRLGVLILLSIGVRLTNFVALPTIDENGMCGIPSYTGIADEAGCYSPRTGVARILFGLEYPSPLVHELSDKYNSSDFRVISAGNVGMLGFLSGPRANIVDVFGLTDPLIARLAASPGWLRVGHLCRALPDGYLHSVLYDENRLTHPDLAKFYDVVRALTRAPIFDTDRLSTLLDYQLGKYDALLASYPRGVVERSYWCPGYGIKAGSSEIVDYPPRKTEIAQPSNL